MTANHPKRLLKGSWTYDRDGGLQHYHRPRRQQRKWPCLRTTAMRL